MQKWQILDLHQEFAIFLKKNAAEDKKSAKYGDRAGKKAFR